VKDNNVEILTVRAVPDGDEYDKDIANSGTKTHKDTGQLSLR
jgi:hypothetical protein